jgi:DNA replication protein DnaC
VIYTQAIELVRAIRDTWRPHSIKSETEVINSYRNAGLLIVDEIGVQFGAEAEKNQMFDVLDGRYREMRPTLIISNLNEKGLQDCLGSRVFDRLMEIGSVVVTFNWGSYRRVPKSPLGAEV